MMTRIDGRAARHKLRSAWELAQVKSFVAAAHDRWGEGWKLLGDHQQRDAILAQAIRIIWGQTSETLINAPLEQAGLLARDMLFVCGLENDDD